MTDFSVPQRMSLSAFFIYFLKFFKQIFSMTVIFIVFEIFKSDKGFADSVLRIATITGCTVVIALVLAVMSYFKIKFYVENGNLIYRLNLISRATTTIPLNRIHTLRTRQGLLYRILNLRGVLFDTVASKGEEIELILNESDWQSLLNRVEVQEHTQATAPGMPPAYVPSSSMKFSNTDLLRDALCQNHLKGMLVLGGFATIVFNNLSDLPDNIIEIIANYLESRFGDFAVSVAGIAIIMAVTYIVSLMLWLCKVILAYYDLSLDYDSNTLTFSHGLFSRMSSRFARDKVCTLWVKRNCFEKRFGLCTLSLKQALNSTSTKDDEKLKIYGRDCAGFFLGWWLGQDYRSQTDIVTAKSGKGMITRSLLPDALLSAAVAAILWHFGQYGWIILPAIYLSAGIPKGILTMRHSFITLRETYIVIGKGRFARIKNYLKYDNVEVVRITRTPLSRYTGRVSLSLSTSGSTFTISSLRQDQARQIYELLLAKL